MNALKPEQTTFPDPVSGLPIHCFTQHGCNTHPYTYSYAWTADSEWFFFIRVDRGEEWVMACEYATGELRRVAGPFSLPSALAGTRISWASLNAIPGTRDVTFIQGGFVWRADLNRRAERVYRLPSCVIGGNTDVSSDGRWHILSMIREKGVTDIIRVDLRTGMIDPLWTEEPPAGSTAGIHHLHFNPHDNDLILYGRNEPYRRMWLRRVGEVASRSLRDERSGLVRGVCHERWLPDGERIVYHGEYQGVRLFGDDRTKRSYFVGIFDVAKDLPHEYTVTTAYAARQPWHFASSPDGQWMITDTRGGGGEVVLQSKQEQRGLDWIHLDDVNGTCSFDPLCSLHSDSSKLIDAPTQQWCEMDPIWSPDGRKVLFSIARQGVVNVHAVEVPLRPVSKRPETRLNADLSKWMSMFASRDRLVAQVADLPDGSTAMLRVPIIQACYEELKHVHARARQLLEDRADEADINALRARLDAVDASGTLSKEYAEQVARLMEVRTDIPVIVGGFEASSLCPIEADIGAAQLPGPDMVFKPTPTREGSEFGDVSTFHNGKDGSLFIRGKVCLPTAGPGQLLYGSDGPVKVWVNGRAVGCEPTATNPALIGEYRVSVEWQAGENTVLYCLNTNHGKACGVYGRAVRQGKNG